MTTVGEGREGESVRARILGMRGPEPEGAFGLLDSIERLPRHVRLKMEQGNPLYKAKVGVRAYLELVRKGN